MSGVLNALSYSLPQTSHWTISTTLSRDGSVSSSSRYLPLPRSGQTPGFHPPPKSPLLVATQPLTGVRARSLQGLRPSSAGFFRSSR